MVNTSMREHAQWSRSIRCNAGRSRSIRHHVQLSKSIGHVQLSRSIRHHAQRSALSGQGQYVIKAEHCAPACGRGASGIIGLEVNIHRFPTSASDASIPKSKQTSIQGQIANKLIFASQLKGQYESPAEGWA